jgi:hypothetical protein
MKANFPGQHFESVGKLFLVIEACLRGFYADFLQTVFLKWERRLQVCCEGGGKYVDYKPQTGAFTSPITCAGDENPSPYRTSCMLWDGKGMRPGRFNQ